MKKIFLFSLVGLLILLFGGCGLMPFTTPGVEQPPEVPEGLEIELEPEVHLELIQPKGDTILIPQNTSIGTWDPVTRIYTLDKDVTDSIYIKEDNLTLDGAGYKITGPGWGYGVYLDQRSNVTVKNCVVSGFLAGILLSYSSSNTLTNNTTNNNRWCGIPLGYSSSNTLTDNTVSYNNHGINLLYDSDFNTLNNNTANDNNWGIYLHNSNDNKVYNNNFINNPTQACVYGSTGNIFNLEKTIGGNYWSDWTSPDDGGDGFVDSAYVFTGGQDDLPWVCQDGWKNIPPVADAGSGKAVLIGEMVQFDGSGSYDPDGTIVSFEWDFGDETTDSGEIVSHIYNVADIYTVTLTITDDDDLTGTDTAEITVQTHAEVTGDLITTVEDFELPTGVEKSLTVLLEAAINALDNQHEQAAIGQLTGFISHVEGLQNGNILTQEQVDTLIAAAQRIIDSIQ